MSGIGESISRLIEIARRLRDAAGELQNVDLKSQIVDEISALQEIRDQLIGSSDSTVEIPVAAALQAAAAARDRNPTGSDRPDKIPLSESSMAVLKPSENGETYSLSPQEEEEPLLVEEKPVLVEVTEDTVVQAASSSDTAELPIPQDSPDDDKLSPEERSARAEMRIAELEPLQRVALKKMNDVLSPEQKKIKMKAEKAGKEQNKEGAELKQFVYSAMKLTPEQKTQISTARKELHTIRAAIAKEVEHLMDDDQKKKVQESETDK